jgi:hypothetical protein
LLWKLFLTQPFAQQLGSRRRDTVSAITDDDEGWRTQRERHGRG